MFCGLEEERTRFTKKKKKKTEKGKIEKILFAAKGGLAGIKGYLETYNHVKHFLSY